MQVARTGKKAAGSRVAETPARRPSFLGPGGVLYSNYKPYSGYGGIALGWAFTSGRLAGIHAVEYLAQA